MTRSAACPQGGVVSPILSNIYLDKLDEFVERELIPQYTRGSAAGANPDYGRAERRNGARGGAVTGRRPGN